MGEMLTNQGKRRLEAVRLSAKLEPTPTHLLPKASSITGKLNRDQCQYETKQYCPASQKQNLLLNTDNNKEQILTALE
ncbi:MULTISPECIES: hypothetical protein [Giesbergeria]|uniref:Uncharacterized protein n=1 Tax=Giesbergeria sinuosa TaxID=80883 RepID=A0ABV9QGV6_9BURK